MSSAVDKITRIFEIEASNRVGVTSLSEVPTSYELLTPEWLTQAVCKSCPDAAVVSFSLDERDDGSSNRRRIFLTYNQAGIQAGLPKTVFCKAAETLQSRLMLGMAGAAQGETNFFSKVRHRIEIEAPVAYHADFDPNNFAYIVVLEDMAGKVEFCDERTQVDWDRATKMVTTLARLHSRFYQSPELGTSTLPFTGWPNWWDLLISRFTDFSNFCDRGFRDAESVIPSRLFKRRAEIWSATERSVLLHKHLPHSLSHNDVHFKNWYIANNGDMGLADWQLTATAHWSKDYTYTVASALSVENRRKWDKDLLRFYLDKMAEFGVPPIPFDDAFLYIRQQLFAPLSFWTVTLRPTDDMPDMQPERTTYEFIKRMTTAMDDFDSLDSV